MGDFGDFMQDKVNVFKGWTGGFRWGILTVDDTQGVIVREWPWDLLSGTLRKNHQFQLQKSFLFCETDTLQQEIGIV